MTATVSAVVAVVAILSGTPTARADGGGIAGAQSQAQTLLAKVHRLQARVAAAERAYSRSLAGVAQSVTAAIENDRATDAVREQTATATDAFAERVRGLYMAGGPLALYATLLQSGDITDFQDRAVLVGHVVSADASVVRQDTQVVAAAAAQARTSARAADRKIRTERSVAGAAVRVQRLLAQEQVLLAQVTARVTALKELAAARAAAAAQAVAFSAITTDQLAQLHVLPPSPLYLSLYHRAATTCPGLSWTVLAAIGQVESGHGRNPSMSSAGALGPMQFLPSTFATYAVDGDGDGRLDIMDPADAIFTAAAYLCANGAGRGPSALPTAIWHYNHADWYVQMVLTLAKQYEGYAG